MSLPKLLILIGLVLFGTIGVAAIFKKRNKQNQVVVASPSELIEIELGSEAPFIETNKKNDSRFEASPNLEKNKLDLADDPQINTENENFKGDSFQELPEADRIEGLFTRGDYKLPIVETITYKSKVSWLKGRPAWLSDYASHYATSRHFIARSLNQKADYFKQEIGEGDKFNVLRSDINLNFHLVIDISRSKMWFYYHDLDKNERMLLKTYPVGLGRVDKEKSSGFLTPIGKYTLGNKIAIYKPKTLGFYNGQQIEMIRVFGTRWIPFEKEVSNCTSPAKGFGIHGVPWIVNEKGELSEDFLSLGKYESDGCIRLKTAHMEELFAIIITKPTYVQLVRDFQEADLPGVEISANTGN